MKLSQALIQEGKHDDAEEAMKELQSRQQKQLQNKQLELSAELVRAETKIQEMLNGEKVDLISTAHRNVLEEVCAYLLAENPLRSVCYYLR